MSEGSCFCRKLVDNRGVRWPSKMGVANILLKIVRLCVFIEIFWSISTLFSFKLAQDHEYVLFHSLCSLLIVLYQETVPRGRDQLTWKTLTLERGHIFIDFEREMGEEFQNILLARRHARNAKFWRNPSTILLLIICSHSDNVLLILYRPDHCLRYCTLKCT
jgi:hypothetical protein